MSNMICFQSDCPQIVPESMYYRNSVPKTLMMQRSDSNPIRSVPKRGALHSILGIWGLYHKTYYGRNLRFL